MTCELRFSWRYGGGFYGPFPDPLDGIALDTRPWLLVVRHCDLTAPASPAVVLDVASILPELSRGILDLLGRTLLRITGDSNPDAWAVIDQSRHILLGSGCIPDKPWRDRQIAGAPADAKPAIQTWFRALADWDAYCKEGSSPFGLLRLCQLARPLGVPCGQIVARLIGGHADVYLRHDHPESGREAPEQAS